MTAAPPLVVWRLLDGKAGHEKQSAALVEALGALSPVDAHDFHVCGNGQFRREVVKGAFSMCAPPSAAPLPALIVGAGHRTHLPMLVARQAWGGKCVALMKPTLPSGLFDLIFVPTHDHSRRKPNLVETDGVLCAAPPAAPLRKDERRGLILLGGESRHFVWRNAAVAGAVAAIVQAAPEVSWTVCDSRRTPARLEQALPAAANLRFRSWRAAPPGFLGEALATAGYAWVTADSSSMLYEALAAAAAVGVIDLPQKRRGVNKHARGIAELRAARRVHCSTDGFRLPAFGNGQAKAHEPENRRCARIVMERLLDRPGAGAAA